MWLIFVGFIIIRLEGSSGSLLELVVNVMEIIIIRDYAERPPRERGFISNIQVISLHLISIS